MNLFRIAFLSIVIAAILGVSYVAYRGVAPETTGRNISLRLGSGGTSGSGGFNFGFGRVK